MICAWADVPTSSSPSLSGPSPLHPQKTGEKAAAMSVGRHQVPLSLNMTRPLRSRATTSGLRARLLDRPLEQRYLSILLEDLITKHRSNHVFRCAEGHFWPLRVTASLTMRVPEGYE